MIEHVVVGNGTRLYSDTLHAHERAVLADVAARLRAIAESIERAERVADVLVAADELARAL